MLYVSSRLANTGPKQVSYSEFLTELRAGNLADVQITERELIGILKSDASHPKPAKRLTIKATRLPGVDESLLLKELESHPVKFGGHIEQGSWVLERVRLAASVAVHCVDLRRRDAPHRARKRPADVW